MFDNEIMKIVIAVIAGLILLQIVSKTLKFLVKLAIFLAIAAAVYYFLGSFPVSLSL